MEIVTNKTYAEAMAFISEVNNLGSSWAAVGSNNTICIEVSPAMATLAAKLLIEHGMSVQPTRAKLHRFDRRLHDRYFELRGSPDKRAIDIR